MKSIRKRRSGIILLHIKQIIPLQRFLDKHVYQVFFSILADWFDDDVKFIKTQVE
ncbi:hypothetical protein HMPREF0765_4615 [Sphingobacterium spiritivorum ATCC 33300]|uniref:Uncharacterized protein n=1 Tax=Sphingobacterium spiritivorum ATCC 33300 TaxID=525372 RepID=C2G4V9_SPHSI|nr:hypothetical protein HMPREF0765_4615 [Sphingobacterium spiritivorum ATCC 33300]